MKKKLLSTVLAAAMVLTMTACGNNAQEPAAETGAAAETESAGAETESAGAQTESADASADGKTFIIATDTVFAPFEFNDASNNFVGIDVDLLAAIAALQEQRTEPVGCLGKHGYERLRFKPMLTLQDFCWLRLRSPF